MGDSLDSLLGVKGPSNPMRTPMRPREKVEEPAPSKYGSANQQPVNIKVPDSAIKSTVSRSRLNSRGEVGSPGQDDSHDLSNLLNGSSRAAPKDGTRLRSKSWLNANGEEPEPPHAGVAPMKSPHAATQGGWGFTQSRANQEFITVQPLDEKKKTPAAAAAAPQPDDEPDMSLLPSNGQKREAALIECDNCGRTFKRGSIAVHQKVCQKVFGEKAKEKEKAAPEKQEPPEKTTPSKKADFNKQSEELRKKMREAKKQSGGSNEIAIPTIEE